MSNKARRIHKTEVSESPTTTTPSGNIVANITVTDASSGILLQSSPLRQALNEFMASGVVMPDGGLAPAPADFTGWYETKLRPNVEKFVKTVKQLC